MNAPFKLEKMKLQMRVSPSGKVHLPAALRQELGLEAGGILIAIKEGGKITLTTLRQQMIEMREKFSPYLKGDSVDAFIADRRAEAKREDEGR